MAETARFPKVLKSARCAPVGNALGSKFKMSHYRKNSCRVAHKFYDAVPVGPGRYAPPKVVKTTRDVIMGAMGKHEIGTSLVERQNLTMRRYGPGAATYFAVVLVTSRNRQPCGADEFSALVDTDAVAAGTYKVWSTKCLAKGYTVMMPATGGTMMAMPVAAPPAGATAMCEGSHLQHGEKRSGALFKPRRSRSRSLGGKAARFLS
jgi:hypothetical protein